MDTVLRGKGSMRAVAANVRSAVLGSGASCELVGSCVQSLNDVEIRTMVFEKYYMRASNRASLTVVLTAFDEDISAVCIGSGGGQGAIFRFSWGAEEDFEGTAINALRGMGFR